jgi:flagellar basal-body rod protein FlgG
MVDMITGQRAYEVNSKTVQTADAMLQTAINVKR